MRHRGVSVNCVCRNSIVDKLPLYVVLFAVFLTASVIIGGVFINFHWYSKKDIAEKYLKNKVSIKLNPLKKNY